MGAPHKISWASKRDGLRNNGQFIQRNINNVQSYNYFIMKCRRTPKHGTGTQIFMTEVSRYRNEDASWQMVQSSLDMFSVNFNISFCYYCKYEYTGKFSFKSAIRNFLLIRQCHEFLECWDAENRHCWYQWYTSTGRHSPHQFAINP